MEQQKAYRSLQIKDRKPSSLAMDYVIFALHEKNFKLDVISRNIEKLDYIKNIIEKIKYQY